MTILVIAYDDYQCDIAEVAAALEARGSSAVRLDTDRLTSDARLSLGFGGAPTAAVSVDGEVIDLQDISAVWLRGFDLGATLPEMGHDDRRACVDATRTSLDAFLMGLGVFTLDPPERVALADNKPRQLAAASALGLRVPRTLVSNDAEAVRAFAGSLQVPVISKMLTTACLGRDEAGDFRCVYTNVLDEAALSDLSGLELCPMIFQEQVPKSCELRVTIVGRRVFAAAVDSQRAEGTRVDWRQDQQALDGAWSPHALSADVERVLLQLMDRLGLQFGGIDLVVTPEGEHVFLEVNALGSFSWLEERVWPGQRPISAAVADLLLRGGARATE